MTGQESKAAFHRRAESWVERLRYGVTQNSSEGFASLIFETYRSTFAIDLSILKILSEAGDLV